MGRFPVTRPPAFAIAAAMTTVAALCSALAALPLLILPAAAQQHGLSERPDVEAFYDGVFPPTPPAIANDWSTEIAFPELTFLNPVGLTAIPGTNQLIVWERDGRIWSFDNNPATAAKTLVVDLSANTQGWDDSGLLGLALHPDFQNNRQMWVWYNWRGGIPGGAGDLGPVLGNATTRPPTNTPTRNRLSRFTLDANFQTTQADEYVVIDQKDASVWHNGGGMFFHPENGFLYLTNGDDQNAALNTQRIDRALFSCVIRIDVDRRGGAISHPPLKRPLNEVSPDWPRYFVPNDNPFVGQPDALEEIYALGLRSPHRMSVDPVTGRIFIGDVGASAREEISVIEPDDPPGLNFQWSRIEGKNGGLTAPYIGTDKPPVIDYAHGAGEGSCVVGGYVYRGSEFPELFGKYIFGDNMSGTVWYLDESVTPAAKVALATLPDGPGPNSGNDYRGLGSFGIDANNELYICRLSSTEGRVYKLRRGGPAPGTPLPATLGATGLFSDLAALTPDGRLIPYQLNAPFWSDGALKSRFAVIPNDSTVGFRPDGDWSFPGGSVLVKHFDLPVSDIDPAITRRLETRVIVKQDDGEVYGATYKWRADQSDADLLDGGLTESIPIATTPLGDLKGQDIGNPALAGSTARDGDLVTITAGGTDIWNTSDQFHFAHQLRAGDFDVAVRIESVVQSDLYAKTGLMVRESLAADARHVMALVFPSNAARNNNDGGYEFQYRATTGGGATALYPPQPQPRVNFPDTWLRMKREGDTFIAFSSSDGFTWREYSRTTLVFPEQVYFGLAVTAHTASPRTVAKFHVDSRRQPWYYPSRQDCMRCHNPQAGGVLGPSTRQFNREMLYPNGVTDHQLSAWNHAGLFENGPDEEDIAALEKLFHHDDESASLQDRARSYLDSNCSYCHRPGGVQALWDGRFDTAFPDQGIYYGPLVNPLGNPDARVVVPRSLGDSILHHRVSITGENQMPPLARNLVDEEGVAMLAAWIESMNEESVLPPGALAATAVSQTRVDLVWQDVSDNESGFAVERSLDNIHFVLMGSTAPGATTFTDFAAEPFQTNYYRVAAFGSYVYSPYSNVAGAVPDIGPPAAEIRLLGNALLIPNNDLTPDLEDGTDFGVVTPGAGSVTRSFTIGNLGNATLLLDGSPPVRIEGPDASSFTVLAQPSASVAGPGSVSFELRFAPDGYGPKRASVVIGSNDSDEPLTTFAIAGIALDDGLVAWWRFDDGSGGSAVDATGFGRDGTLTAPLPQWETMGKIGGALRFTGEFAQSVTVPDHPSLNPTGGITIASWVHPLDWNGNRRVLQKGDGDNQYRLLAEAGELVWEIAGVGRLEVALPPVNQWFHLAATYNGARMRINVNGIPVGSLAATGPIPVTADPLHLGTKTPGSVAGDHFNGSLDELRLYNRSLSGAEIGALAGVGPGDGLIAWWKLDEAGGTSAADSSAGRTGTLTAPLPQWDANGKVGGALGFTGEVGQSVTVANHTSLNPSAAISIISWVKVPSWSGNNRILQKGNTDNQYRLLAEFGNFAWDISGVGRIEAVLPPVNQWVHVAATYDGERMALYYDGVEVAAAAASGAIPVTNNALYLGTKTANSGAVNHLTGLLDEVRLYRRALAPAEIAAFAVEGSVLSIVATDATARKGTGDTGTFTVTRTGPTGLALPLALSLESGPGQALLGSDFTLGPAPAGFTIPAGQGSASLTVQPVESSAVTGPLAVTLNLGPAAGHALGSASAQVVIGDSPLHDWKIDAFGSLAAAQGPDAADDADADGDGLDTLLEAALGGSPAASDVARLPVEEIELLEGQLFLTSTYLRPKPALAGISYIHRRSFVLDDWQSAGMVAGYPLDNGDGTETVKFRSAVPVGDEPQQFLRLEITRP
jgi:glucose/arabinose dehydrogenase/mono/diheme cytochrome c family protein/regulation of enolase protein 1 (concanavalin A-like superfamily)